MKTKKTALHKCGEATEIDTIHCCSASKLNISYSKSNIWREQLSEYLRSTVTFVSIVLQWEERESRWSSSRNTRLSITYWSAEAVRGRLAMCEVPRTRTSLGYRSFTVAGLRLWNNLPLHLHDSEHTFLEFCRLLKKHLFCWGQRHLVTVCFCAPCKSAFTLQYITLHCIRSMACYIESVWVQ